MMITRFTTWARARWDEANMTRAMFWRRLPGMIAVALLTIASTFWTFWSAGELFYEGWWGTLWQRGRYLIPAAVVLLATLIVLRWLRLGGVVLIGGGLWFTVWWWGLMSRRAGDALLPGAVLALFPMSGMFVLVGVLFLWEGWRLARLRRDPDWQPPVKWVRRFRYWVALGVPVVVMLGMGIANFVPILLRVDSGDRSAQLIEGNGVVLVWAPEGPGWARGLGPDDERLGSGYPSWDAIAFHGLDVRPSRHATAEDMAETGLCRYLSADGLTLMDEPQDIWRMPTVDEIVRSLVWRGENAGCTWDGESHHADCTAWMADKDWPLWAPDWSPVYYWAADEFDDAEAWYVNPNGHGVSHQPKDWGNPRHGFRCVREPTAAD